MDLLIYLWDEHRFTSHMNQKEKEVYQNEQQSLKSLEYYYYHGHFRPKIYPDSLLHGEWWNPGKSDLGILYKCASMNMSHIVGGDDSHVYEGKDDNRLSIVPSGNYTRKEYRRILLTTQDDEELALITNVVLIYRILFLFFLVFAFPIHTPTTLITITLGAIMVGSFLPWLIHFIHVFARVTHPFYGSSKTQQQRINILKK